MIFRGVTARASSIRSISRTRFADVVIPLGDPATLTVRGGRQELLFGVQRLVGPSDWTNVRRTFQGVSGIVDAGGWRITPMWAELVVVDPHKFDEAAPGNKLYGVYASGAATKTVTADVYWLGVDNASTTFNGTSGRERRQTIGGRLWRGRAALTAPEPRSTREPSSTKAPVRLAPTSTWRWRASSARSAARISVRG